MSSGLSSTANLLSRRRLKHSENVGENGMRLKGGAIRKLDSNDTHNDISIGTASKPLGKYGLMPLVPQTIRGKRSAMGPIRTEGIPLGS